MKNGKTLLRLGLALTALILLVTLVAVFWTPQDPEALNGGEKLLAPSLRHLCGTDQFGRDIFSRILKGMGTTFSVALWTVLLGGGAGIALGLLTGTLGGRLDRLLMRLNDALTAFPSILLALVIIGILGPGKRTSLILALGLAFIPSFARVTRTAAASLRERNFVTAARLRGMGTGGVILVHILPNCLDVLLPALTIGFNNAVLAEASMSYLGIGITPPDPSLGYMLAEAQSLLRTAPWYALTTGLAVMLIILSVGLIGDGLRKSEGREL